MVIASPSTANPNYLYTWIRDASLVFKALIDQYTLAQHSSAPLIDKYILAQDTSAPLVDQYILAQDTSLGPLIDMFVQAEKNIQQVTNPSGSLTTGGLGEPKFNIDESAFTGPWGRPQRDSPALRSTAIITYANWVIANGNMSYFTDTLWPVIQLDLDYVANNWNQTTFDLWEELDSSSFFTSAVQHRALRQGASLATAIGQTSAASLYTTQADDILCFIQACIYSSSPSPRLTLQT